MNRNLLIAGSVILVLIVLIAAGVWLWRFTDHPAQAGQKLLITKLGYCSPADIRPCIVSFSQAEAGQMLVNLLIPSARYPDFYLLIRRENEGNRYECEKVEDFPTNVSCTGPELFPGQPLQFILVSKEDQRVLAEGQFAIIGLMLSTPIAETLETLPATESPTPFSFDTPIPLPATRTPTATISYPNPYPNP